MIQRMELDKLRRLNAERDRAAVLARAFTIALLRSNQRRKAGLPHPHVCGAHFCKWATSKYGRVMVGNLDGRVRKDWLWYGWFSGLVLVRGKAEADVYMSKFAHWP